jgi:hypothetical protein
MSNTELIPSLFAFTLVAVAVIAAIMLVRFLGKRGNRHPMDTPQGEAIQRRRDDEVRQARADGVIDPPANRL